MATGTSHADDENSFENVFLAKHQVQLETSSVPKHLWKALYYKLKNSVLDAGDSFSLLRIEYEEKCVPEDSLWKVVVTQEDGIRCSDPNNIYLIDHAWTYLLQLAIQHLYHIHGLLNRMADLMDLDTNEKSEKELVDEVYGEMWKFNQIYNISGVQRESDANLPIWYIMDEFGSRIQHSDVANFCTVPFYYIPEQLSYTLLFPIKNVMKDEEVTRDFAEGSVGLRRKALLLPWKPLDFDFLSVNFSQEESSSDFFCGQRASDTYSNSNAVPLVIANNRKLKVYAEYRYVTEYLNHPRFLLVDNENDADILWYFDHFKAFRELREDSPHKMVNQFPYEHVITTKDLLAIVCRRKGKPTDPNSLETYPVWLPTTYNLENELPEFVSYFQHRKKNGLDNHWMCKPWNLARGLDTYITSNLNCILRLATFGPKIAQKYVQEPVLFHRVNVGEVKFDFRYIVLLRSVEPLEVLVYKRFWLRFSNKEFSLDNLYDYDKHFTVMNYSEGSLMQMFCHDFIEEFEIQNPGYLWADVQEKIFNMFRDIFDAATSSKPPASIGHNPQSRAVYGIDLILEWQIDSEGQKHIQPKLLEVNWSPDCRRACEYYSDFYNDIFSVLFLGDDNSHVIII